MTPRSRLPIPIRLLSYALPYKKRLALAVGALMGLTVFQLVGPLLVGYAINTGIDIQRVDGVLVPTGNARTLFIAALLIVGAAIARGVFQFWQTYTGEWVAQRVAYDLRNDIYDHLQRLSFAYHDEAQTGQIMQRATQDVEGIRMFVNLGVIRLVYVIILLISTLALMLWTDWRLALLSWLFIPPTAIIAIHMTSKLRPIWLQVQNLQGELGVRLQENLTRHARGEGVRPREVRIGQVQRRGAEPLRELLRHEPHPGDALAALKRGLVAGDGRHRVGRCNPDRKRQPERRCADIVHALPHHAPAPGAQHRLGEHDVGARRDIRPAHLRHPRRRVGREGEAGRRRHRPADRATSASRTSRSATTPSARSCATSNIDAEPGQVVALLGQTGSGKTTVVNLMPRFYDVTGGAITIDGLDIRDVTLASLRREYRHRAAGRVPVLGDDPRQHRLRGLEARRTKRSCAAAKTGAHPRVHQSLPDGYDTWVGERGITLSGGQKQRISIARTLLLDPKILVFDDSTSSVDTQTEYLIQQALADLMKGRTTFVIAQRLRTVKNGGPDPGAAERRRSRSAARTRS